MITDQPETELEIPVSHATQSVGEDWANLHPVLAMP